MAPASAQEELLQELKTVARVEIEGRHQLSAGAIRKVLKTRGLSRWPWRDRPTLRFDYLRADVQAIHSIYVHNGFLDASADYQVSSTDTSDRVIVTFLIHEGERSRIREVDFQGNSVYATKDLRKEAWARATRAFDPAFLQLDTLIIAGLYQERGYRPHVAGHYRRGQPDSTHVDVAYAVQEGSRYHIGELTISGQDKVKDELITREILLKPGNTYQLSRVTRTQERLYGTGLFSQVQIEPLPDSTHTTMNFDIRLRERLPRWIDAGVGSGTDERFRLTGEWGHRNVAGRGMQAVIASRLTFYAQGEFQRWHIEGSLVAPWLAHTWTRGIVTPFYERYDDRGDKRWVVEQEFRGVNFQLRRELSRFARIIVNQENLFARQELVPIPKAIEDSSVTQAEIDSVAKTIEPDYTTHRLSLGFERDLRDNPFSPNRGSALRLVAEVAGGPLQGTSSFHKYEIFSSWYTPVSNYWVLATRAVAGVIDPFGPRSTFSPTAVVDSEVARVPLEDRFRTGGVNSIRGYDENVIPSSGGLAIIQGNIEARIPTPVKLPFLGSVGFEGYVDAGNVWARAEYVKWSDFTSTADDPNTLRVVAGFGPRIISPIGPLRIDVSWRMRPTHSHPIMQFAIGPSF